MEKKENKKTKITDSKNIVSDGKIEAGGNVHIGDIVNVYKAEGAVEADKTSLPTQTAEEIRKKIARSRIKQALEQLLVETKKRDEDLYQQMLQQSERWNNLQKDERLGLTTYEQAGVIRARIVSGLLGIVQELEDL